MFSDVVMNLLIIGFFLASFGLIGLCSMLREGAKP